ncbi:S1 RNA-binding domain-containing protein [Polyangium aurulentum]|uniref:S1 RNA-binding domain-containing protein n=1 Tax=Polyangium aurulentum TaxID=2567896 RepID=UPI0010AE183A|nr:S1 RNA-binding domain-containing protein [Polyangium aurulentum]UQA57410.1 S1 RNA-binding domain-containing protein [Polyangium aurulentum]
MSERRDQPESFGALFEQTGGGRNDRRRYHVGDKVEVTVVVVAQNAVFADLGGKQEGFFERADLSDPDGKLLVAVGSKVSAAVASIDRATGQVRLQPVFVRGSEGEPVTTGLGGGQKGGSALVLVEGARVKGTVTGIERYGVFVQIAGATQGRGGRGLIPTQETATPRGADLKKHFSVGQEVEAKIVGIDEQGKIRLSITAIAADEERSAFEKFRGGGGGNVAPEAAAETSAPKGGEKKREGGKKQPEVRGFGTLGDLLSKKTKK